MELRSWTPVLWLFVSDSGWVCWVPCVISFHVLLRACFLEHRFSHFLLLVSALFASLLLKGTEELLRGPSEPFVQRVETSVRTVTGSDVLPAGPCQAFLGHDSHPRLSPLLMSGAMWEVVHLSICDLFSTLLPCILKDNAPQTNCIY